MPTVEYSFEQLIMEAFERAEQWLSNGPTCKGPPWDNLEEKVEAARFHKNKESANSTSIMSKNRKKKNSPSFMSKQGEEKINKFRT
ncbi:hypothetical protein MAR_027155 [Mya arenaria]|uniref:Uncharacterized protein n=1 Tax=Mya arenaria TaxID=6604 RepID=A0ABY7ESY9_MYAAR|nr:hypothetical protein MAR_027155 [Mya arenaria]